MNKQVTSRTDTKKQRKTPINQVKFIDLFCGMGSFHYSFKKLGFKCVMASDIYKPAKTNYKITIWIFWGYL